MKMRNLALTGLIMVVIAGFSMGCIEQNGPTIPTKEEMPGYSQGWEDGKQRGFTTGYVAYLRAHNLSEDQVNYDVETTPQDERLSGYDLGEQQGYKSAWGYGYDIAISLYEPVKWEEFGYILPGNETATDFYAGLGYNITKYKIMGRDLTDVLKQGSDQAKAPMNKAQLVDSIAKGVTGNNTFVDKVKNNVKKVSGGDSEVEVITYKSINRDVELVEIVEVEVRA